MQLAEYQSKCLDMLYSNLVDNDKDLIMFTGPKGSGKSTIIEKLAEELVENWQVFLVSGTGIDSSPYYTWYSAARTTGLSRKIKLNEVSFGVNFEPIGIPLGIEVGLALDSIHDIFNNNEQSIIKSIQKKIGGCEHFLLIADSYSTWDLASQTLFQKIIKNKEKIFENQFTHLLLVDNSQESINVNNKNSFVKASIPTLTPKDVIQILNQQPCLNEIEECEITNIIDFTGYDLRLINLAVGYTQKNTLNLTINSLTELLDIRISEIRNEHFEVCQTLEKVSIINMFFSEKEAAFLLDKEVSKTEQILDNATKLELIYKYREYHFPNNEIKEFFSNKLDSEKKYLHNRFAQYLQCHFPADYFNRASHLFLSQKANSEHNIFEAAYLLAIEVVRRYEITGFAPESVLEKELIKIMDSLPQDISKFVQFNIEMLFKGYNQIYIGNYLEAISYFSYINVIYSSKAFSIETLRLHILSLVQLADDLYEIKNRADDLYEILIDSELNEDELWCRAALLLLEIYGDRHVNLDKFQELRKGIETRIRNHMHQSTFRALSAKYNCKAALFYNALIATQSTEESCKFYRDNNSIQNLYYSLCNNAANRIICGEYINASIRLKECKKIISDNRNTYFPSVYKIENNDIINSFLLSEGVLFDYQSKVDRQKDILTTALDSLKNLKNIKSKQGCEVSHVIEFNILSMLLLTDNTNEAFPIMQNLKKEYEYLDLYYRYYLESTYLSYHILQENYEEALISLEKLISLNPPLLSNYNIILKRRNNIIQQLIEEKFKGNGFNYNYEFVRRSIHIQDMAASFWGRGFLLSDLQFLSF